MLLPTILFKLIFWSIFIPDFKAVMMGSGQPRSYQTHDAHTTTKRLIKQNRKNVCGHHIHKRTERRGKDDPSPPPPPPMRFFVKV